VTSPRWREAPGWREGAAGLAGRGLPPLAAELLAAFVEEPSRRELYFADGPPVFPGARDVPGLAAAAERVVAALGRSEKILVHGDYDVDGLMGAAVLVGGLRALGGSVDAFIPSRFEGGYGLSGASLQAALDSGASLMVTADCGTNSREVGESLAAAGVDLVVTDHHTPAPQDLSPGPLVNPHLDGGDPELRCLCGASVAYLLVRAAAERMGRTLAAEPFLRLLAVATVADVVPMSALNRRLCRTGFRALETTPNPGLALLLQQVNRTDGIASHHVSFHLAPRMNAAGRIEDARLVLDLLLERDAGAAALLVGRLEHLNDTRKALQAAAYEGALRAAAVQEERPVLFAASPEWHKGVVGPVAARLSDRAGKSAFVVAVEGPLGSGSARAFGADDVTARLAASADLLERFGGHTGAAGFTVRTDRLADLEARLSEASHGPPVSARPYLPLPAARLPEAWRALLHLDPLGPGAHAPLFALEELDVRGVQVLKGRHLRWDAASPTGGPPLRLFAWDARERGLDEGSLRPGAVPLVRIVPELRRGPSSWLLQVEGVL